MSNGNGSGELVGGSHGQLFPPAKTIMSSTNPMMDRVRDMHVGDASLYGQNATLLNSPSPVSPPCLSSSNEAHPDNAKPNKKTAFDFFCVLNEDKIKEELLLADQREDKGSVIFLLEEGWRVLDATKKLEYEQLVAEQESNGIVNTKVSISRAEIKSSSAIAPLQPQQEEEIFSSRQCSGLDVASKPDPDSFSQSRREPAAAGIAKTPETTAFREPSKLECPAGLWELLEADILVEGNNNDRIHIDATIRRIWKDTSDEIKATLPPPESENYKEDLLKWKHRHFGTLVSPLATGPGDDCPKALVDILVQDFRCQNGKHGKKYAGDKARFLWSITSDEIRKTLPPPHLELYEEQLAEWKIKHFGRVTPLPVRERRPRKNIIIDGCPPALVEVLRECFERQRQTKANVELLWESLSLEARTALPMPQSDDYKQQLQEWKTKHCSASFTSLQSTRSIEGRPNRKRALPKAAPNNTAGNQVPAANGQQKKTKGTVQYDEPKGTTQESLAADAPKLPIPFTLRDDPNEFYVEEEAHLYHNPPLPSRLMNGVAPKDLKPIPPPSPFRQLPNTGKCKWSFDELQRILLADFSASVSAADKFTMDPGDEAFLLDMMERDDITVISEGLISTSSLNPDFRDVDFFRAVLGEDYYHKFRRFDTIPDNDGFQTCIEVDEMYSMQVGEYIRYLEKRRNIMAGNTKEDRSFSFVDHQGRAKEVDAGASSLYMIDADINKVMPSLYVNFLESFRYPQILPGGTHCMMRLVAPTARPFMGPNMYVTPPASFTHFHQDGHGTVDSGHLCLTGFNEVVILRRLTERHKKHALMILTGNLDSARKNEETKYFDGLYQEPHDDKLGEKPAWPTKQKIEHCRKMGYCPTLCVVKPGQLIHINKGRLHAFRKMSTTALRDDDCHKELRVRAIKEHNLTGEELCVSIAWDWMYRGISAAGINREILTILEAATLNRKMRRVSLGIPEFSLLQMAKMVSPLQKSTPKCFGKSTTQALTPSNSPSAITMCRGILPSLRHILKEQSSAMALATNGASTSVERGKRLTIAKRPNTHENNDIFPLDPYGCDGFSCKLCSKELSNLYYHCDGCEQILSKDFNICQSCHKEKLFMISYQMHPNNPKRHSTLNHTGNMNFDRASRCPCKNGPTCKFCHYCSGCSCRCHTWFTLHSRLFDPRKGEALLKKVEATVNSTNCEPNKYLDNPEYVEQRLEVAERLDS